MTDRKPGAPGQYKAVITASERAKMQNGQAFTIHLERDDQPITEGTPYSKAAVLPDELAAILCPDTVDPTPADALSALLINGGVYIGDLNILGDGGVPLNSVVWVTPDTINVPHSNWGFVETWQAQTGSEIQRYTGIDKVTYVRTRFGDGNSVDWHGGWQRTDSLGKLKLLWSNSNPTSSFPAQTVPLTLSGYDYVGVASTWDIDNPHRTLPFHIATVGGSYDGGYLGGKHVKDSTFVGRSMDVSVTGVTFAGGYKDSSSSDRSCIPFAIFGLTK